MKFKIIKSRGSENLNNYTETVLEVGFLQYIAEECESFIGLLFSIVSMWLILLVIVGSSTFYIYLLKTYF